MTARISILAVLLMADESGSPVVEFRLSCFARRMRCQEFGGYARPVEDATFRMPWVAWEEGN